MAVSAGILLYRVVDPGVEMLVAHPGGPFWAGRDEGAWSIPKGELAEDEAPNAAAVREFEEETGHRVDLEDMISLGTITQRSGKIVHGYAARGDLDPATLSSNLVEITWPPRSTRRIMIPEIDRVAWVGPDEARRRLNPAQGAFVDRLLSSVEPGRSI